ncbi:ABC transporter permease [Paenibacillus swuensis]|uniref:ABC transporter permease n=1 Tax=Paenibacillus swuensis TaxID=1178515 RepID=A0A172TP78_9BACL|nr:sugar ABC transporter permease [Paenibacillus swuensis]ANE48553.1 ABC transporter permease [Paenibacillus swuensis]
MYRNKKASNWLQQLVFIGPAFAAFLIIIVAPFVMGMYYSFTNWNGVSNNITFAGFDNFVKLFSDEQFLASFGFTVRFTIVAVIVTNLIGFLLALMLTQALKSRNLLRTVFFLPNVIGGLLLGFIWQFIFVRGFSAVGGMTNIGFFNLPWLGDEITSFWALVIVSAWQGAGYLMVIYIASLVNVPKELNEAAEIDGATAWQRLRNITIPLVMPAVTICLFLTISNSFKMFDLNLSLTKGGPFNSTQSVALNIYLEAFQNNRYGLGTAKAFIFFVVVALVSSVQVYLTKKQEVEA